MKKQKKSSFSVALRKLALKSTMNFGTYYDLTVQQVLDQKGFRGIEYLVWSYYSCSNISYLDDILDLIGILDENKIEKPSKIHDKRQVKRMVSKATAERIRRENDSMSNNERAKHVYNNRLHDQEEINRKANMNANKHNRVNKDYSRRVNQGRFNKK